MTGSQHKTFSSRNFQDRLLEDDETESFTFETPQSSHLGHRRVTSNSDAAFPMNFFANDNIPSVNNIKKAQSRSPTCGYFQGFDEEEVNFQDSLSVSKDRRSASFQAPISEDFHDPPSELHQPSRKSQPSPGFRKPNKGKLVQNLSEKNEELDLHCTNEAEVTTVNGGVKNVSEVKFGELQSRLKKEAENIMRWKLEMENKLEEKSRKICDSELSVNNLRQEKVQLESSLSDCQQQLEHENDQKNALNLQISTVRQLCQAVHLAVKQNEANIEDVVKVKVEVPHALSIIESKQKVLCDKVALLQKKSVKILQSNSQKLNTQANQMLNAKNEVVELRKKLTAGKNMIGEQRKVNDELLQKVDELEDAKGSLNLSLSEADKSQEECNSKIENLEKTNLANIEELNTRMECIKLLTAKVEELNDSYVIENNSKLEALENLKKLEETSEYFEKQTIIIIAEKNAAIVDQKKELDKLEEKNEKLSVDFKLSEANVEQLKTLSENTKNEKNELLETISSLEAKFAELSEGNEDLFKRNAELQLEKEQINSTIDEANNKLHLLEIENIELKNTVDQLNNKVSSLAEKLESAVIEKAKLTAAIEEEKMNSANIMTFCDTLTEEKQYLINDNERMMKVNTTLEKSIEEETEKNKCLVVEMKQMQVKFSTSESQCEMLSQRIEELSVKLEEAESQVVSATAELEMLYVKNTEIEDGNSAMTEKSKMITLELSQCNATISSLKETEKTFQDQIVALKMQVEELEKTNQNVAAQLEQQTQEIKLKEKKLIDNGENFKKNESSFKKLSNEVKEKAEALMSTKKQLEDTKSLMEEKDKAMKTLQSDLQKNEEYLVSHRQETTSTLEQYAADKEKILAAKEKEIEKLKSATESTKTLKKTNTELKTKLKKIQHDLDTLKTSSSKSEDKLKLDNEVINAELKRLIQLVTEYEKQLEDAQKETDAEKTLRGIAESRAKDLEVKVSNLSLEISSPPNRQRPILSGGETPRTPRSGNLLRRLTPISQRRQVSPEPEVVADQPATPQKTPRGILKAPGSASKRHRVIFGGESSKQISDIDSSDNGDAIPLKRATAMTPRTPKANMAFQSPSNLRRTPITTPSSRHQKVFLRRATPPKEKQVEEDTDDEPDKKIRVVEPVTARPRSATRRRKALHVAEEKNDCWFDNDPIFGFQTVDEE